MFSFLMIPVAEYANLIGWLLTCGLYCICAEQTTVAVARKRERESIIWYNKHFEQGYYGSRMITEVEQHRNSSIARWVTAWE